MSVFIILFIIIVILIISCIFCKEHDSNINKLITKYKKDVSNKMNESTDKTKKDTFQEQINKELNNKIEPENKNAVSNLSSNQIGTMCALDTLDNRLQCIGAYNSRVSDDTLLKSKIKV